MTTAGELAVPIAAAVAASSTGAELEVIIAALEKVQPADLGRGEIRAKLGAPWIPASDVRAFAAEILSYPPTVTYLPITAQWEVKAERGAGDTAAASAEWGTGRIDAYRLLELSLNGKAPVVYDTIQTPDGETRVRNQAETMLAEEKQRALAARFGEWVWEDPQRCDRLCAEYNHRFNSVVPRRYDGAHLTFPGLAEDFQPYPHQRDMVHRIISSPASLCPYPVGTGKTPVMFMAARKLRELGLARKPLIIVPNHLLEQTAREGKRLFPSARILMAAREDLADAQARKLFAAHGFAQTSVDAIAAEAGVAKGAVYHHFQSKEQILDHIVDGLQAELAKQVKALEEQMFQHARNLEFEQAAQLRDRIRVMQECNMGLGEPAAD